MRATRKREEQARRQERELRRPVLTHARLLRRRGPQGKGNTEEGTGRIAPIQTIGPISGFAESTDLIVRAKAGSEG
jgi:hypothetical protein